jgi:hypothetical protein
MFELQEPVSNGSDPLTKIGDTLVADIPEPQQHAIDQAASDAAADPATAGDASVEVDALGVPWDPAIHAKSATTGKGVRNAKGAWRKRRGLAGSSSYIHTGATGKAEAKEPDAAEVARATAEQQSRMAGAMVAQTMIYISIGIGGEEFAPRDIRIPGGNTYNEKDMLSQVWGDYFAAKGVVDIPPGIALLGGLSMYYLPRLREPAVRKRAGGFIHWTKEKISAVAHWWKYRKGGKPREPEAPRRRPTPHPVPDEETLSEI